MINVISNSFRQQGNCHILENLVISLQTQLSLPLEIQVTCQLLNAFQHDNEMPKILKLKLEWHITYII